MSIIETRGTSMLIAWLADVQDIIIIYAELNDHVLNTWLVMLCMTVYTLYILLCFHDYPVNFCASPTNRMAHPVHLQVTLLWKYYVNMSQETLPWLHKQVSYLLNHMEAIHFQQFQPVCEILENCHQIRYLCNQLNSYMYE